MNPSLSVHVWEIKKDQQPAPLSLSENTLDEVSRWLPQGLYTTFRTFGGGTRALDLKHHLDRLYAPAAVLGIRPSITYSELRGALAELLNGYQPGEARVRVSLSTQSQPGAVFVAIEPLHAPADEVYRSGVRVVTSQLERADPTLKSTAFLQKSAPERKSLAESGAFEALMLNNRSIREGLTSNFYYVKDGVLGTARRGILPGVTRRLVLRLARKHGLPVRYQALALDQLTDISEAFITSSSRGIVPVVRIDDVSVGWGTPGPITRQLMGYYAAYVQEHARLIVS